MPARKINNNFWLILLLYLLKNLYIIMPLIIENGPIVQTSKITATTSVNTPISGPYSNKENRNGEIIKQQYKKNFSLLTRILSICYSVSKFEKIFINTGSRDTDSGLISFFLKTNLHKEKLFYNFAGSEIPTFESMVDDTSYRRKETSSSGHDYIYNLSAGATNDDAQKAIDTYIDSLLEYGGSLVIRSDRYATLDYVNTESPKKSQEIKNTSFSNIDR